MLSQDGKRLKNILHMYTVALVIQTFTYDLYIKVIGDLYIKNMILK